jgi:hypothetical protein
MVHHYSSYRCEKRCPIDPTCNTSPKDYKPETVFSYIDDSLGMCTEIRGVSSECAQSLFPKKSIQQVSCQKRGYTKFMNANTINQSPLFFLKDSEHPCKNKYAVWSTWLQ